MARRAGHLTLRSLDRTGGDLKWWPEWNTSRDTVVMWPSDTTLLNGERFGVLEDGVELDTIRYRTKAAMPFNLKVDLVRDPVTGKFSLVSSRPIASIDLRHAVLRADSVAVPLKADLDTLQRRTLHLDLGTNSHKALDLILYPKAITGMQDGTNDTTRLSLGVVNPRSLGKLTVHVVADSVSVLNGPLVLQLLTAQGRVVRQVTQQSLPITVLWEGLSPAEYHVRLIEDRDGNGAWSTGSLLDGRQPERVFLMADPVVVRAGWALEENWKFHARY
jgi:hypothetical protein